MTDTEKTPPTISRIDAEQKGLKLYFTGVPCKNGHIDSRYMSGTCVSCKATRGGLFTAKRRETDPVGFRASVNEGVKRHYQRNKEAILEKKKAYYRENAERIKAEAKAKRAAKRATSTVQST